MTLERKILGKICSPKCEQGVWRLSGNLELQNAYKYPNIVTEIKIGRLKWLEHISRMEDTGIPERILNTEPEGGDGVGIPKLRWLDDVQVKL